MSQFVVQITPLIRPDPGVVDEADFVTPTQFADLDVGHPVNGFKTAKVTLSMHDPAVAGLKPYEFALRVLYENRLEPVFWGQSNITDDYEQGVCILEAQDPSLRMLHHYLRRGDTAINALDGDIDQGAVSADANGISLAVEAAQNIPSQDARNDPSLGLTVLDSSTPVGPVVIVERGQECWQVVTDIAENEVGPEFTMETPDTLDNYAVLVTYDSMGTDRTSATPDTPAAGEVVFDFGLGADNAVSVVTTPSHPTTHAHVLSEDRKYRETSAAVDALSVPTSNRTGVFVDWVRTGFNVDSSGDTTILKEKANAVVRAYGVPLEQTQIVLRPDAVITENYGRPAFTPPGGTRTPTFYLGDKVTIRATRGERSITEAQRITEVHLTWPGWQGPALTVLTVIPVAGAVSGDEES